MVLRRQAPVTTSSLASTSWQQAPRMLHGRLQVKQPYEMNIARDAITGFQLQAALGDRVSIACS
jgi:hypothetical protein